MNPLKTLDKLSTHEVSLPKAYALLGPKKRPARFVKLKIHQKDKGAQRLLNVLFLLPLPIRPVFFFIKKSLPKEDHIFFKDMLLYAKGIQIDIETSDTNISIHVY